MMSVLRVVIQISKGVLSYLYSRLRGDYAFSCSDLRLHLNERYGMIRPPIHVKSHKDNGLDLLEIGERIIFWPSEMSSTDLSWLFSEVFAPWAENPSSYDHPVFNLQGTKWIIDAGACEGFFSLFALERGARRVIAVEPLKPLWRALRETFVRQASDGRFELFEGALGCETGMANLSLDPLHACEAAVASSDKGNHVPLTTLDELGRRYCLGTGGVIKMDIEGAEMDALRGGAQLLLEHRPKLAIAVYHGYENALLCRDIILRANPSYQIEFRGMYGWFHPPRPYMLFAW
jgi:FkbM family methyltransferase